MRNDTKSASFAISLLTSAVLASGCQSKGPAPGRDTVTERVDVTMAERESSSRSGDPRALGIPADEHHRDYGGELHGSPHKPGGDLGVPDSHVSGDVRHVDVGSVTFESPAGWEYEHPNSAMRRAQFGVRAEEGTAGLVVYFFGNQGAGSSEANIERWVSQFKNPDGSALRDAVPTKRKIAGFEVTQVEVAGTYVGGMGAGASEQAQSDQRMIATIVETPGGPYYFKFLGDDTVVKNNQPALEALLGSMKPSER